LGQPKEIKPTVGGVGGEFLVTVLLYRGWKCGAGFDYLQVSGDFGKNEI
jgi:hypothetical protein